MRGDKPFHRTRSRTRRVSSHQILIFHSGQSIIPHWNCFRRVRRRETAEREQGKESAGCLRAGVGTLDQGKQPPTDLAICYQGRRGLDEDGKGRWRPESSWLATLSVGLARGDLHAHRLEPEWDEEP